MQALFFVLAFSPIALLTAAFALFAGVLIVALLAFWQSKQQIRQTALHIHNELEALKYQSSRQNGDDADSPEALRADNIRLHNYNKQMEADRNRMLAELKLLHKKMPDDDLLQALAEQTNWRDERKELWTKIVETEQAKTLLNQFLDEKNAKILFLNNEIEHLETTIAQEMPLIHQKYLDATDEIDALRRENEVLTAYNYALDEDKKYWQTEFANERKITTALSAHTKDLAPDFLL